MRNVPSRISLFRSENWASATYYERLAALQEVENSVAVEQNRPARLIMPEKMEPGYCGYYTESNPDYLQLNEAYLTGDSKMYNSYGALETVLHEGRHAYQDDAINGKVEHDELESELWQKNFDGRVYIDHDYDRAGYRYQPIENDANNFAHGEVDNLTEVFGTDPSFHDYLENREYRESMDQEKALAIYGPDYVNEVSNNVSEKYDMIHGYGNNNEADEQITNKTTPSNIEIAEPSQEEKPQEQTEKPVEDEAIQTVHESKHELQPNEEHDEVESNQQNSNNDPKPSSENEQTQNQEDLVKQDEEEYDNSYSY